MFKSIIYNTKVTHLIVSQQLSIANQRLINSVVNDLQHSRFGQISTQRIYICLLIYFKHINYKSKQEQIYDTMTNKTHFAVSLCLLFSTLLIATHCQQQPTIIDTSSSGDMTEQVRRRQYAARDSNKMNYQNVQSYTIKAQGVDSFHLSPQVDQQVKCQLYVYWKQDNIFISSEYRQGEEIRVLVYEDEQRILLDRTFYMVYGLSFNVKKGSSYEIRFLSSGRIQKLVALTISKMLDSSKALLDSTDVLTKQQRITSIGNQIQAFFSISQRNFIVQKKLTQQVLSSTQIYMGYQIVEILLVLLISAMQTIFISKILSSNSIV